MTHVLSSINILTDGTVSNYAGTPVPNILGLDCVWRMNRDEIATVSQVSFLAIAKTEFMC